MPIVIQCASCNSTFKVDDNLAGKKVKCRKCAAPIAVPEPMAEPSLDPEPVLSDDASTNEPALAPRTCPSCGAAARANAVMCLTCGHNFRTGKSENAPQIELADDAPVAKKRSRFLRAAGKRVFTSIDSLIFMITFWLFIVSLIVWAVHVIWTAGGFSFPLILPTLIVVGLLLIVVVPIMAIAIKATCNTMQYPPRHDNYIRAATALAFPLAISLLCSGGSADNPMYATFITLAWLISPILFGYLFRAEIPEWVGTVIAGGAALALAWLLISFVSPYIPTITGPLYVEALPQGPWAKLANAHMPPAKIIAPAEVTPTPATPIASTPPVTTAPIANETIPPTPTPSTPAETPSKVVILRTTPSTPTPTPSTEVHAPPVVVQAEGLAEITADPDLQNVRQIIPGNIISPYFLAVKDSGEGEVAVQRWTIDPMAKNGELSFQELPKEPNDYALNPAGTILISLSHFPKNQMQISSFDKPGPGKKIALDHLQVTGTPKLMGFIDANHFILRWSGNGGLLQVWSTDGVLNSFTKSEGMTDNLNQWTLSPNPAKIGAKLAALMPGDAGSPQILVGRIDGWSLVSKFTPLNVSYQEGGLAFSPDANTIGICALTSDGGTVLTFDVKSGENKQTIIFGGDVFPSASGRKRIAHGLVWMENGQLLLVGGTTLYDTVTGKKLGSLGLDNIVDAHNLGPNSIILLQESENGVKNALVAKVNASLVNTAKMDEKK